MSDVTMEFELVVHIPKAALSEGAACDGDKLSVTSGPIRVPAVLMYDRSVDGFALVLRKAGRRINRCLAGDARTAWLGNGRCGNPEQSYDPPDLTPEV